MAANSRVYMAAVRYATFQKGQIALSGRGARILRQTCEGDLCDDYQPDTVFCENLGADGVGGYTWQCKAELPKSIQFGEINVSCEGWDGPDDAFVLDGSCAVTYALLPTSSFDINHDQPKIPPRPSRLQAQAFDIVFYSMTVIILYTIIRKLIQQHAPRWTPPKLPFMPDEGGAGAGPGPGPGGGGGGHEGGFGGDPFGRGGDNDDPFNPDLKPSGEPATAPSSADPQETMPPDANQRRVPRAGLIGGVLAATGLGALFASTARRDDTATGQRQPPAGTAIDGRAEPSTTVQAQRPPAASRRIGQESARRRQTYEGFWGVQGGSDDDVGGGGMRMTTGFGSSRTR